MTEIAKQPTPVTPVHRPAPTSDVSAWSALIEALRVAVWRHDQILRRVHDEHEKEQEYIDWLYGESGLDNTSIEVERRRAGEHVAGWLNQEKESHKRIVEASNVCLRAGIDAQFVGRVKYEATMVTKIIDLALENVDLTEDQQTEIRGAIVDAAAVVGREFSEQIKTGDI